MSSVRRAKTYFRRKKPIKRLPRDLVTPFNHVDADTDEITLMKAMAVKDRHAVRRLFERYGVSSAKDVLPFLPKPRMTPLRTRLLNWLRRLEGSSEYDPLHQEIDRMNQSEVFTIRHGYRETPLK